MADRLEAYDNARSARQKESFFGLLFVPGFRKPASQGFYKPLPPRLLTTAGDWVIWFTF